MSRIGVDEVGRGALAGPVVSGAVFFENSQFFFSEKETKYGKLFVIRGDDVLITDSKKLTAKQRNIASDWILQNAQGYGIGVRSVTSINKLGIVGATNAAARIAIRRALSATVDLPEKLFTDAFLIPKVARFPVSKQEAVIRGDALIFEIAAASIVAKVYRDTLMERLGDISQYLPYLWSKNKGYGTKDHRQALLTHGITQHHRELFVRNIVKLGKLSEEDPRNRHKKHSK